MTQAFVSLARAFAPHTRARRDNSQMDRELTPAELKASIAAMPAREEPDFLRPPYINASHEPPTPTMSLEGFKTALLKRRLREIDAADRARVVSKTTIAKEIKAIKHELRGTKARAAASRLASRHREIAEETRTAIIDDIHAEIAELGDLVAELVDLATDVRADEDPAPVELAELAAPIVERQARRTERTIELDVRRRAVIEARPQAVSRAIRNLVENATKFSPDGTSITVIVDGGAVTVLDAGPGIPEADRSRVFDRFHRVEATRTMPGSGLGLAIVRQVAEAHGGSVSATEAPGGGAAVGFVLPTVDD